MSMEFNPYLTPEEIKTGLKAKDVQAVLPQIAVKAEQLVTNNKKSEKYFQRVQQTGEFDWEKDADICDALLTTAEKLSSKKDWGVRDVQAAFAFIKPFYNIIGDATSAGYCDQVWKVFYGVDRIFYSGQTGFSESFNTSFDGSFEDVLDSLQNSYRSHQPTSKTEGNFYHKIDPEDLKKMADFILIAIKQARFVTNQLKGLFQFVRPVEAAPPVSASLSENKKPPRRWLDIFKQK